MNTIIRTINRGLEQFGFYLCIPGEQVVRNTTIDRGTINIDGNRPAHIVNNVIVPARTKT